MTDNNEDIDHFFREMEQVSGPDMQHYQANWNAMQDMLAGKPILTSNQRWNRGMFNSMFSLMLGGCLVAGLIFVFSRKQQLNTTHTVNPPAALSKPVITLDTFKDTLQNDPTFYELNKAGTPKAATPKAGTIRTYPSDTLIADRPETEASLQSLIKVGDHSKKPALQSISTIDSTMENQTKPSLSLEPDSVITGKPAVISTIEADSVILNQKSNLRKPVSFSSDTVVINFKNITHKPTKKTRPANRVDTITRKQKHLPNQTIHH